MTLCLCLASCSHVVVVGGRGRLAPAGLRPPVPHPRVSARRWRPRATAPPGLLRARTGKASGKAGGVQRRMRRRTQESPPAPCHAARERVALPGAYPGPDPRSPELLSTCCSHTVLPYTVIWGYGLLSCCSLPSCHNSCHGVRSWQAIFNEDVPTELRGDCFSGMDKGEKASQKAATVIRNNIKDYLELHLQSHTA